MPVVAFVPLTILWAGTGDTQKFLIIFIGTFFQQVLLVMDNVKSVPRDFIDLGRTLEMPEWRILQRIVLPSAMPAIWDSLRISLGWAWTWLVVAELVAATSGLGYRITTAQRYLPDRSHLRLSADPRHPRPRHRPGDEVRRPPALPLSWARDGRAQARHRRPGQDLPHRTRGDDGRAPTASTSPSARMSSSPWSAPRAAASPRCCRSPPDSKCMTRGRSASMASRSPCRVSTAAWCSRATLCCPG